MKKAMMLICLVLVMATPAYAGWVDNYYGIHWDVQDEETVQRECNGSRLFEEELTWWPENKYYQEVKETFHDGYHYIEFEDQDVTVYKNKDVQWFKSGYCVPDKAVVSLYNTKLNLEETKISVEAAAQERDNDHFMTAYNIMKQIDGISPAHKIKLISIGIRW